MQPILVSGLINLETTLRVEGFPVEYHPVCYPFYGVHTTVSGVGYNIAKALTILGNEARFLSLIGKDQPGRLVMEALDAASIPHHFVLDSVEETAQSVIIYDKSGRRAINLDLKDIQERQYPEDQFDIAIDCCSLATLCNINFSRPFLKRAQKAGVPIATDVHAISDLEDEYNRDFMAAAHILFMSDEHLPYSPREWADRVINRYGNEILVIGMGAKGALLSVKKDHFLAEFPPIYTRPVVNTIGAGDALFSCFIHIYNKTGNPYIAIRKALLFASYKIGETGAADGFLTEAELDRLYA